jgi:cyclohexadienyl dehydratase
MLACLAPHSLGLLGAIVVALALVGSADADEPAPETLRIGTSGDYPPFSLASGDGYEGFDIALARAYAAERALEIEWVRFAWPQLVESLEAGRFDVAMSGVTVRPERTAAGRYTVATVEAGAVALVADRERFDSLDDLDRPRVRIGVNRGGHLERVARARFPRATLIAIPDNRAVRSAFVERRVDAVVTETHEAAIWEEDAGGALRLGPFTRDRKAWLVRRDLPDLAADLDAFLLAREADGSLAQLRRDHLGASDVATAEPVRALLAAIDERLSLMPIVGVVKRDEGVPLAVPEREQYVLDAAVEAFEKSREAFGSEPLDAAAIRGLFRAQMDAAKQVQWSAVKDASFAPETPLPGLDDVLRPALLRVGERITRLVHTLPVALDVAGLRRMAEEELRTPYVSNATRRALAEAVTALRAQGTDTPSRTSARAARPARMGSTRHVP